MDHKQNTTASDTPSLYVQIHRLFRRLQQRNRFVGRVQLTGLSPVETHFILELAADQRRSISELSTLLRIDQSFGSRIAQMLCKRKLLSASSMRGDGRRKSLTVTSHGRAVIRAIDAVANDLFYDLAAPLSTKDMGSLVQLYRMIADGYQHPPAILREGELEYRAEQRRITRCLGLLGEHVFESDLSATSWQLLAEAVLCPVAPQPTELAALLSLAQNSLTSVIATLEQEKLIKRVPRKDDKRAVTIHPLPAGIRLYHKIEEAAARRLQDALQHLGADVVRNYLRVFRAFLRERDTVTPPLPSHLSFRSLEGGSSLAQARGLVARCLVMRNTEHLLPERLFSCGHSAFGLFDGAHLVAVAESAADAPGVIAAGWSPDVSPWVLLGFIGRVHIATTPDDALFSTSFVQFAPLREHFGLTDRK